MNNTIKYTLLIIFSVSAILSSAQRDTTLTQEVEVVKSFKPTLSDANKINEMPKIDETEHQKPKFDYSIYSQPILNTFSVNTLKAASFIDQPSKKTGYGLVRAGVGNYNKPYGEIYFNNLNSKKSIFGLHAKHLSSFGKINLAGNDKVDAPYSKNKAELFLNHLFRKSILAANIDFNHDGFNYYGYPLKPIPDILKNKDQSINYLGTKQAFTKGGLNVNLTNPSAEIDDPSFGFDFSYHYFKTKTEQVEHFGEFTAKIQQPFNTGTGLLEAGLTYVSADNISNRLSLTTGKRQQTWLFAKPAYYFGSDVANVKVGLNAWFVIEDDMDAQAKIAPALHINLIPVKSILKLYAGINGNFINNHYSKIAYENPFVDPMHDVKNSFKKIQFYGGLNGKFSAKTNFKIGADYSLIDDRPFYYLEEYPFPDPVVNPNPFIIDNDFKVLYDDIKLMKFNFEIFHSSSEKLDFLLSGNYYSYETESQKEAWNMPKWEANLSINYKISEQLNVSTDIFLIGERKTLIVEDPNFYGENFSALLPLINKSYNLETVFDMNIKCNYKITDKFSVFGQLNNFGFQKYERWFGYPVQSFNFLGGLSYTF